jgi:hypothetical protein
MIVRSGRTGGLSGAKLKQGECGEEAGEGIGGDHLPALAFEAQVNEGDQDSGEGRPAAGARGKEQVGQQAEEEEDFEWAHRLI